MANPLDLAVLYKMVAEDWAQRAEALRDELAACQQELAIARIMVRGAMDALALVATVPERYETIQREQRKEREAFMGAEFQGRQKAS